MTYGSETRPLLVDVRLKFVSVILYNYSLLL